MTTDKSSVRILIYNDCGTEKFLNVFFPVILKKACQCNTIFDQYVGKQRRLERKYFGISESKPQRFNFNDSVGHRSGWFMFWRYIEFRLLFFSYRSDNRFLDCLCENCE